MFKKMFTVRQVLTILLLLSIAFAGYSIYYKIKYWGFSFTPKQMSDVWTIEAHVTFTPTGDPIKVSLTTPSENNNFKIMEQDVIAEGYKIKKIKGETNRVILTSPVREGLQNIYYRVMLFDNQDAKGKTKAPAPAAPKQPFFDEQTYATAQNILKSAKKMKGDEVQQIINLFNQPTPDANVLAFRPLKKNTKDTIEAIRNLLALKNIPTRTARGIKLAEEKKSFNADLMLEAYISGKWKTYNVKDGTIGVPSDFILFQRGGDSLLDVEGGEDSTIKFSVIKSVTSSINLAGKRADIAQQKTWFDYSIYNLPIAEQNVLKWLMIFPLGILITVLLRNIVGITTMGTFTPMLLAMSLVKTGLAAGLISFGLIMLIGLSMRALLSKLNLLLVPRIAAVVIFVILIMQTFTVLGYRFKLDMISAAAFFPIIIMAWIIERASIIWEEDGAKNACQEIINSLIAALITYFVINNEVIRHVMYAFNELNLVILFMVMLLGTYTGYRLTELRRFSPIAERD